MPTIVISPSPDQEAVQPLLELLRGRRAVVLAGAGCSTESGIPDYRGPEGSLRTRSPMQYQEFVRSEASRVRYWARSTVGWTRFSAARPNAAHHALAELEDAGVVRGIITQNVDGLHHAAGSRRVVELHGSLASVRCLVCGRLEGRAEFQARLVGMNAEWADRLFRHTAGGEVESAPDGDAELPQWAMESFRVPECEGCGGVMKPDVVFFGENVPAATVEDAWRLFGEGDVLLVADRRCTCTRGGGSSTARRSRASPAPSSTSAPPAPTTWPPPRWRASWASSSPSSPSRFGIGSADNRIELSGNSG
jgi:NAD-dependent SIR2 family protein deacetylase